MKQILLVILTLFSFITVFPQESNPAVKSVTIQVDTFPIIFNLIGMVDTNQVMADIQYLQDFGSRKCWEPGTIQAQNWIKTKFEQMGLSVELQHVYYPNYQITDNVLATKAGRINPNEFVIIGGHYDSDSFNLTAPGADDNASGTSGVIEIARILSQYEFKRSIVFCAFSAEELFLRGSETYANRAQQLEMNILGYFNLDMIGYNAPGEVIHTDLMAPPISRELANFYKAVTSIYLPDFIICDSGVVNMPSDHVSFCNHGFMGILSAEEDYTYSPFIHTAGDVIGPSVNSSLKAQKMIQAALSSVVTLAIPIVPVGQEQLAHMVDHFRISPNPAHEVVNVELTLTRSGSLEIFDVSGQKVFSSPVEGKLSIDISGLSAGSYLVKITGRDFMIHEKLIIQ